MQILSPVQATKALFPLGYKDTEEIWCLYLSSDLKLLGTEVLFRGTIDSCPCHPREIFKFIYKYRASRIILAHNHPQGQRTPSATDLRLTLKISLLCLLAEVPLEDHLILTKEHGTSLRLQHPEYFGKALQEKYLTQLLNGLHGNHL